MAELTVAQKGQDKNFLLKHYERIIHPFFLSFFTRKYNSFSKIYKALRDIYRNSEIKGEGTYYILDLACGTGWYGRKILTDPEYQGYNVFVDGSDLSQNSIDHAKMFYDNDGINKASYKLSCYNAHNMPAYEDERFSEIWLCGALHQIPEPAKTLKEVNRILKDEGIFYCQTFVATKKKFRKRFQKFFEGKTGHVFFDIGYLKELLSLNDMKIIDYGISKDVMVFAAEKRKSGE